MRIVYMGSPDFAVPPLKILLDSPYRVAGVVTQPDRQKGRGYSLAPTPVKETAVAYGLPLLQCAKVNLPENIAKIAAWQPDIIVVVAFGQLLKKELLQLPPLGVINIHASLLPAYRGAAPIHWAVIRGEKKTGVTTMYIDEGMDTGNIILQREVPIGPDDDTGTLHDILSREGAELLLRTLEAIEAGKAPSVVQDNALASYAPLLKKEDEVLDWSGSSRNLHDHIRGMVPWPVAYTLLNGKRLKVWRSAFREGGKHDKPGQVLEIAKDGIWVACGEGELMIKELQAEGKKPMAAAEMARGNNFLAPGVRLG